MISETRLKSSPVVVRLALPNIVGVTKAWISTKIGRLPSIATTIADPVAPSKRSSKKTCDGLATSFNPPSSISKIPISLVDPKRFLTARKIRKLWCFSPSKYKTVSTICSSIRGPAIEPSFVTWPTIKMAMPLVLAIFSNSAVVSRTWLTLPATLVISGWVMVWIESMIT